VRGIGETALWTAAYRAEETDRPDALFHDPYAQLLAGARGRDYVRRVSQPDVRWGVVLRTVVLDELILGAVRRDACDVVVSLGAGLDSRPYRLDLPSHLRWVEADLPGVVEYKTDVLQRVSAGCTVQRHGVDLSDRRARRDLFADIASAGQRVLVVAEGLLGYLSETEVGELADDLHAQRTFVTWATHFFGSGAVLRIQHALHQVGVEDSSIRFAPTQGADFFRPHGWVPTQHRDLFEEMARLGRPFMNRATEDPARWPSSPRRGRIVAVRLDRIPTHRPPPTRRSPSKRPGHQ
jgi:methyltransferase (TIGR00027 family)